MEPLQSLRHRDKLQDIYLASKLHEATPRQVPSAGEKGSTQEWEGGRGACSMFKK